MAAALASTFLDISRCPGTQGVSAEMKRIARRDPESDGGDDH
jgi:hypothetical protein